MPETEPELSPSRGASTRHGAGRVLVVVYAILAIGSTSRALYELATKFSQAPVPYALSAIAAVVYCVITWALVTDTPSSRRVATVAMIAELVGVVVVGTWSVLDGAAFPKSSVWFWYGRDYLFVPLVLPVWGLAFLWRTRSPADAPTQAGA
jgi:hypothetical protein